MSKRGLAQGVSAGSAPRTFYPGGSGSKACEKSASLRILPKRMLLAFPAQDVSVAAKMAQESLPFSSDHNGFLFRFWRHGAQGIFPSMLKNQDNGLSEVRHALFARFTLAVSTGHLGAVRNVPRAVAFDDCREFISHASILAPPRRDATPSALAPWVRRRYEQAWRPRYNFSFKMRRTLTKLGRCSAKVPGLSLARISNERFPLA